MTTMSAAFALLRARIEANTPAGITALRWQNEDGEPLPDTPAPFLYIELEPEPQFLASFGGGVGSNLWRNPARLAVYVFVPRGQGLALGSDLAEAIATLFRGYRSSDLQCFEATIYPFGSGVTMKPRLLDSEIDNYYVTLAEIALHYDLIG